MIPVVVVFQALSVLAPVIHSLLPYAKHSAGKAEMNDSNSPRMPRGSLDETFLSHWPRKNPSFIEEKDGLFKCSVEQLDFARFRLFCSPELIYVKNKEHEIHFASYQENFCRLPTL